MKKLRLDLEDLSVESFSTTLQAGTEKGTVFGQQCTCYTYCTCPGGATHTTCITNVHLLTVRG